MIFRLTENSVVEIEFFSDIRDVAKAVIPSMQNRAVAISGGSTYSTLFEIWRELNIDTSNSTYFPVDERVVDISHIESNWRVACENFLKPLGLNRSIDNFAESKESYLDKLNTFFKNEFPLFDTIFLGVGDDGHTASLFPNSNAINNREDVVLATESPKGIRERITIGSQVIAKSKEVITILTGDKKRDCLDWLKMRNMDKPFVKVLSYRATSKLYISEDLMFDFSFED